MTVRSAAYPINPFDSIVASGELLLAEEDNTQAFVERTFKEVKPGSLGAVDPSALALFGLILARHPAEDTRINAAVEALARWAIPTPGTTAGHVSNIEVSRWLTDGGTGRDIYSADPGSSDHIGVRLCVTTDANSRQAHTASITLLGEGVQGFSGVVHNTFGVARIDEAAMNGLRTNGPEGMPTYAAAPPLLSILALQGKGTIPCPD